MERQPGTFSLPAPVTMQILSAWDNTFKKLSREIPDPEEQYLVGEYHILSLILQQMAGISRKKCQADLLSNAFFQNAYKQFLKRFETVDTIHPEFLQVLETTQQLLNQASIRRLPPTFLGDFFERFGIFGDIKKKTSARKATGSFFTPLAIAQFIVNTTIKLGNFTNPLEELKCLDPACGSGIFLVELADLLLQHALTRQGDNTNAKAKYIRHILTHQIWGIDLSPNARRVSQLQLILWAYGLLPQFDLGEMCSWVVHCTQGDFLQQTCTTMPGFSVIVGNPPFGNLLSYFQKKEVEKWATTRSREISELFLERALGILIPDGCLGFVMPKTMAYYIAWNLARRLVLPVKLAGVADLGLSFPGVNFETLALFVKNSSLAGSEDQLPIFAVDKGIIGTFPRQYIRDTGLIPLQPLDPDDKNLIEIIRENRVPIPHLIRTYQITRGIYLSEQVKTSCRAGNLLWLNRVPDIQHYAIRRLWKIDPEVFSQANPKRFKSMQVPKVLLKVLRGRKLSAMADPWGILVPTEKLVSILLDEKSPREILAWNACVNSWPASYFLQKVIFSGTTESARVLDYPYLEHIPVLANMAQSLDTLSGIILALMLAAQISVQFPPLLLPGIVYDTGILFQQTMFLSYMGKVPRDPQLAMKRDFEANLQLLHDLFVWGAIDPPAGGLSRNSLLKFTRKRESDTAIRQVLESRAQSFVQKLDVLHTADIAQKLKKLTEKDPHWQKLVQYFNAKP